MDRSWPTERHRDDLQGLRGVAILLVVLGHAGVPFRHISQTYALELAGPFRAAFRHALFASP